MYKGQLEKFSVLASWVLTAAALEEWLVLIEPPHASRSPGTVRSAPPAAVRLRNCLRVRCWVIESLLESRRRRWSPGSSSASRDRRARGCAPRDGRSGRRG